MGKSPHTSDEFIIGSYIDDTVRSSKAPECPADDGNIASATEYNPDATKIVDYTTDPGLEGGAGGG